MMKSFNNGKRVRAGILLIIIAAISMPAAGCDPYEYRGEYPELYSVAVNSVLGSRGYIYSEKKFDAELSVLESDGYGRNMFVYFEERGFSAYNLVISQKSDGDYVYYYPDFCFLAAPENDFPPEEVEGLKRMNDWGKEIDLSKCTKAEIVRCKAEGPLTDRQICDFYFEALGEAAINNYRGATTFFSTDSYGRSIYLGFGYWKEKETDGPIEEWARYMVLLFNPDGSYDAANGAMEIKDVWHYQG